MYLSWNVSKQNCFSAKIHVRVNFLCIFERESGWGKKRERKQECFYFPVHIVWVRLTPGDKGCILVSYLGGNCLPGRWIWSGSIGSLVWEAGVRRGQLTSCPTMLVCMCIYIKNRLRLLWWFTIFGILIWKSCIISILTNYADSSVFFFFCYSSSIEITTLFFFILMTGLLSVYLWLVSINT